jgi:hypothetical protein
LLPISTLDPNALPTFVSDFNETTGEVTIWTEMIANEGEYEFVVNVHLPQARNQSVNVAWGLVIKYDVPVFNINTPPTFESEPPSMLIVSCNTDTVYDLPNVFDR